MSNISVLSMEQYYVCIKLYLPIYLAFIIITTNFRLWYKDIFLKLNMVKWQQ